MRTFAIILGLICLNSCQTEMLEGDSAYAFVQPEHFPAPTYNMSRNPITEKGFLLGKRLFEEVRLSRDSSVSCSSCHQQAVAFADPQHRISLGVEDRAGTRNAPGLFNLAFVSEFMLDGGIVHLDFVPINAITSHFEMDESLAAVVEKLTADASYRRAFQGAFGSDTIASGLILQALSQYQLLLISDRSKYDDVVLGRNGATFSPAEKRGYTFFRDNCGNCHTGELFTDGSYRNNGLDMESTLAPGRSRISESPADRGKFRVPSLRNVGRTRPYMHDGRLQTLEEVLRHYQTGVNHSSTLDPSLSSGIPMTEIEQQDLLEFLQTLTDWEFLQDPRF